MELLFFLSIQFLHFTTSGGLGIPKSPFSPELPSDQVLTNLANATHLVYRRSPQPSSCPSSCQLPSCFCGLSIPGGLLPAQTPQLVLITFDDAVNVVNTDFYQRLFAGRTNPNGCGIAATFYISHEWTDYGHVQDLYSQGHEIASHTITHSHPTTFNQDRWAKEVVGQAELLVKLGNVNPKDIQGMRAPFLQTGGDLMFSVLSLFGFLYDSSLTSSKTSPSLWPYTLDHDPPHSCSIPPCPTGSHPGLWEIPMTLMDDGKGGHCPMLDGCQYDEDVESIQSMLTSNFLRHYTSNKAPFPMFYHAAWFKLRPHREEALFKFIDTILELPDVYFVTSQQLLQWVRSPSPLSSPQPALACPARNVQPCGDKKRKCDYGGRTFYTCAEACPVEYPWL
eukprot:GFUD01038972.1.p1 GENE.GFUD01038972.1~~GFUD01038972.1.p1  ORF type:complete len:393 (+),score=90.86 GFUD01038972.1:42-1220(+)